MTLDLLLLQLRIFHFSITLLSLLLSSVIISTRNYISPFFPSSGSENQESDLWLISGRRMEGEWGAVGYLLQHNTLYNFSCYFKHSSAAKTPPKISLLDSLLKICLFHAVGICP